MDQHSYTANAESEYIDALYKAYKKDPQSIDSSWQKFFEGFDFAKTDSEATWVSEDILQKELQVSSLINAYRTRGHLKSTTNPIRPRKDRQPRLELPYFGLTEEDLTTAFEAGKALGLGKTSLKDIITTLEKIYCGNVGFEYAYIKDAAIDDWLKEKIERDFLSYTPNIEEKKRILAKLNEASVFENFLQLKYIGQKRFSLEGGETTIPALDAIIQRSAELGVQEIVIGMAHRGRLNVLANIIGKTYESIFDEFEGNVPLQTTMGDGDVKYHLGYTSEVTTASGNKINLKLAPNPSHLEAVNAVVEGFTRAKVERQYGYDFSRVIPVLIHGDAALAGQGIGYEVIQMSDLKGYYTGGTIHFVINNQIGFTTDFDDARSSTYCTDLAKLIDAPVIHVNGDDPEAVVFCVKLAVEFRQKFNKDIFIDMVCYRRHGHNEGDEPKFTQPSLYNLISKHPGPREVYSQQLIQQGDIEAALAQKMEKSFKSLLQDRLNLVKQKELTYTLQPMEQAWRKLRNAQPEDFVQSPNTGVPQEMIEKVGKSLVKLPPRFKLLRKIEKLVQQRATMFFKEKKLNWASAELLAYGTILLENKSIRLAGQDVQRGTFSHRHATLNHAETNEPYYSLAHIDEKQGKFSIYNSLLSENAALGFEFGYAMA
ncbi:MAG: 2-oxoglutarate dehydrogenase E1 component, partial [Cytophagales bacterium]|nr:2-oxoglutarate dehydrogenase E1 component [Cytophagales bacterium]